MAIFAAFERVHPMKARGWSPERPDIGYLPTRQEHLLLRLRNIRQASGVLTASGSGRSVTHRRPDLRSTAPTARRRRRQRAWRDRIPTGCLNSGGLMRGELKRAKTS